MTIQVNIGEAKTRLSELVAASLRGEEVILARAGKPVLRFEAFANAKADQQAQIVAERAAKMRAAFGAFKGKMGPNAGDIMLEPEFTNEELDSFEAGIG